MAVELYTHPLFSDATLKAYYRAEDLNDASSNGKTLTKVGTVNEAVAQFGNGFSFTSTDATNHLYNTSVYQPGTGDLTLGCWFKKNGASTDNYIPGILTLGSSGEEYKATLAAQKTTGYIGYQFYDGTDDIGFSTTNICDNVLHLVVMTRSGTTVALYVDGSPVSGGGTSARNIAGAELHIGYIGTSSGFNFIGAALVDDIFVFGRALSATEILNFYNAKAASGAFFAFL